MWLLMSPEQIQMKWFLGEGAKAAAGWRDLTKRLEEGRDTGQLSVPCVWPGAVSYGPDICDVN